jgi:hypothetical protein
MVAIPRQATAGRARGVVLEVRRREEPRRTEPRHTDRVGNSPAIEACKTLHGLAFKKWRRRLGELPDKAAYIEQQARATICVHLYDQIEHLGANIAEPG